jgi:integrase
VSANVSKDAKGYRINIRLPSGRTTCIRGKRLGIGQNQAAFKSVEFHISNLIGALAAGTAIPAETQAWVRRIGSPLRKKLERLGLIQPRTDDQPLIDYLRSFFSLHGQGRKAGSKKVWARALSHAEAYFNGGITLQQIDVSIAKGFRSWLQSQPGRKPGATMATATVNKTCGLIGQALSHAVELGLIASNPCASRSIPKTAGSNPDREQYVDRQTILSVISSCDDSEDRIVLALARFGCLRVPSEARELRWSDIDWEKREMLVHSPKTAHLGKACRKVPLFPDLYDLLRNEYESGTSSEFLLSKLRLHPSLSMRVHRAAVKAGVAPWEKALQNLRASGVEDWLRAGHLPQDVARWCGHTPKVMYHHYMRIKDADSASNAALQAALVGGSGSGSDQAPDVVSAVVTSRVATSRQEKSPATEAAGDLDFMEFADDYCELLTVGGDCEDHLQMDLIGLEPTTSSMPWMRSSN